MNMAENKKSFLNKIGIIPKYDTIALFLVLIAFILLLALNLEMRESALNYISQYLITDAISMNWYRLIVFIITVSLGLVSIFKSVFPNYGDTKIKKESGHLSKVCVLFIAILTDLTIAFSAGLYVLRYSAGLWAVFPALNMMHAFLLLILFSSSGLKKDSVIERHPEKNELKIGLFFILLLVIANQFFFESYWAITLSICLVYANNFHKPITKKINSIKTLQKK